MDNEAKIKFLVYQNVSFSTYVLHILLGTLIIKCLYFHLYSGTISVNSYFL